MKQYLNPLTVLLFLALTGVLGFNLLCEKNSSADLATALGFTVTETRLPENEDKRKLLGIVIRNANNEVVFASGPKANDMSGRIAMYTRKISPESYETSVVGDGFSFVVDFEVPSELSVSRPLGSLKKGVPFLIAYTKKGQRVLSASVEYFKEPIRAPKQNKG